MNRIEGKMNLYKIVNLDVPHQSHNWYVPHGYRILHSDKHFPVGLYCFHKHHNSNHLNNLPQNNLQGEGYRYDIYA